MAGDVYCIKLGSIDDKKKDYIEVEAEEGDGVAKQGITKRYFRDLLIENDLLWVAFSDVIGKDDGDKSPQFLLNEVLSDTSITSSDDAEVAFRKKLERSKLSDKESAALRSIWQVCRSDKDDVFITFAAVGGGPMKLYYCRPEGRYRYEDDNRGLDPKKKTHLKDRARFRDAEWLSTCKIKGKEEQEYELLYAALPGNIQASLNARGTVFRPGAAELIKRFTSGEPLEEYECVTKLREKLGENDGEGDLAWDSPDEASSLIGEALSLLTDKEFERFIDLVFLIRHRNHVPVGMIGGTKYAVDSEYVGFDGQGCEVEGSHYYIQAKGHISGEKMAQEAISKLNNYCPRQTGHRCLVYHSASEKTEKLIRDLTEKNNIELIGPKELEGYCRNRQIVEWLVYTTSLVAKLIQMNDSISG